MTMVRGHKPAVGGYGATAQPRPVGHEAKAPKAADVQQQPAPGGAKYHADTFEAAKPACKGGHAAEGKKEAGGHKKEQAGGAAPPAGGTPPAQGASPTTPPAGGTPPAQGAYPTTPPAGEAPPAGGTPPVGQPADGAPEQGIQKAVEEIATLVQKLIEALGGQPSEPQQTAPNGNTGIVPPGAVQGTPPVSATPYAI
jgi:hypothetical protein